MPSAITFWSDAKLDLRIGKPEKAGADRHKYGPLPPLLAERENRRYLRDHPYRPYQPPADDGKTPSAGDDPFR